MLFAFSIKLGYHVEGYNEQVEGVGGRAGRGEVESSRLHLFARVYGIYLYEKDKNHYIRRLSV